jgi:K+ transporter
MDRINAILKSSSHQTVGELFTLRKKNEVFADRSVFIVSDVPIKSLADNSPPINGVYFSKYELLPQHLIYLTVVTHQEAEMKKRRIEVYELDTDPNNGTIISVVANFGFMEDINLNKVFRQLKEKYPQMVHSDQKSWVFHIIHPKLFTKENFKTTKRKIEYYVFKMLWRNSMTTEDFLGVDHRMNVTAEVVPVKVN